MVNKPCRHRTGQLLHALLVKPTFRQALFVVPHDLGKLLVLRPVGLQVRVVDENQKSLQSTDCKDFRYLFPTPLPAADEDSRILYRASTDGERGGHTLTYTEEWNTPLSGSNWALPPRLRATA